MITDFDLVTVQFIPRDIIGARLYYSEEFKIVAHLCACGCGNKIITPIEPSEWSFNLNNGLPSLYPSIGNWELPCRSHYWIKKGRVVWSDNWSDEKIIESRIIEEKRRELYYENNQRLNLWYRMLSIIKRFFDFT